MAAHSVAAQNCTLSNTKINDSLFTIRNTIPIEKQVEAYKKFIKHIIKCKDTPDSLRALAYHRLGYAYFSDSFINSAFYYTTLGINLRKKILPKNHIDIGNSNFNLGLIQVEKTNYKQAINLFNEAIAIYNFNKSPFVIDCYAELCDIYKKLGDFQKATGYYHSGIKSAKNELEKVNLMINFVNVLKNEGRLNEAISTSIEVEKILKPNIGDTYIKRNYAINLNNRGNCYRMIHEYDKAIACYALAKKNYEDIDEKIEVDGRLAASYAEKGEVGRALKMLSGIQNSKIFYNDLYYHAAIIENKSGLLKQAITDFDKAIKIETKLKANSIVHPTIQQFKNCNDKTQLFEIIKQKALVEKKIGEKEEKYLKKSLNTILLADSLIDLMRQEHTEQGSKLFWREKTHSLYENALETCYQLKDAKNAFYFMEKSRAILLLDALKDLDAKQVLSATQQSTEQDLRYRVIGLQNKLESLTEKDKNYNATYQQLIDTKEKYNAFIQSLEKTNPAYYQLKYNNKYLTLNDLQNKLKSTNQSFVEYFVGDSAVYVMAITAKKVDFKKLNLATYRNLVGAFQTAVSQVPQNSKQQFEAFKYISNQLYAYIFAPLHLPKGRIVISQDNYFIPFAALITDLKNTKYLIEDYAFSYAYSANVLFKKQDKNWHFRHQLLGVSPVDFSALGMNSLPKSDETLKAIEQNYFSGKILVKEQATKQNFIENAPKYSLLQLFTHGKADSTEAGSKIFFYDKILKLSELYQLPKLSADLVVLSACQTNLGKNATGEGIMSFARGFAYLNVPSTVSTLWSVDNEATYQITEAFYKFLEKGFEKDIALQKAQLLYLKNNQIDPYFWSGMVLVGDAQNLQNWSWIYYTIVASIVLIITFLTVRRKN